MRARSQRSNHAGHGIGDIVVRARCVVNTVAAASCSTVLQANDLRERLHDTFTSLSAGKTPTTPTLAALSAHLSQWYAHGRLVPVSHSLQWVYSGDDELERPLWEVARAAARLLTSPLVGRVRACAAEDCGWWFLDDTKNASRRWCDMKICGNRDKVRRFRERNR